MLNLLKAGNLALAFILELNLLFIFGYWGMQTKQVTALRALAAIAAPALVAALWGFFLSPKAVIPIGPLPKLCCKGSPVRYCVCAALPPGTPIAGARLLRNGNREPLPSYDVEAIGNAARMKPSK
jgi:hypothetical protein